MDYQANATDLYHLKPSIDKVYNEKYQAPETPKSYTYDYWLFEIGKLIYTQEWEKIEASTYEAAKHFASVYALASSVSNGAAVKESPLMFKDEYEEDHARFNLREEVFLKPWTKGLEILKGEMGSIPAELEAYIKRGCISKAPNTEEDFIKWAVYPMQDPELFRKDYRITQDLRKAYRQLIKAAGPYIKAANNVEKAEKLYKDFYNFTALEWLIVLPM